MSIVASRIPAPLPQCANKPPRRRCAARRLIALLLAAVPLGSAVAQEPLLQPGEAFVTRFSGVTPAPDNQQMPVINTDGTVGSIIDIRAPGQAPGGLHWVDEPQRRQVTAGQVGQVFGVALDDQNPPNVYLTATAAFGLHRTADNSDWMPGMWGPGGPGAVYVLDRTASYQPRVLADLTLSGRPNSGAALGNIAYDRWNKQLFVSDMETGMIHRLRAADGADGGTYDHGTQGRPSFLDVEHKQQGSLQPIAFDPSSSARIADCPNGFATTPECWNVAQSGRRVWGVGVWRNANSGEVRLYYAVWSSPAFGNTAWAQVSDDEKRNAIWSVLIAPDGNFDPSNVRREFALPDFFVKPEDIARAGFSQPVSDISFPACSNRAVMLLAERGGMRNLGLAADNAFATPHEARALRYELYQDGEWRPVGRYDVGFYDRHNEGEPFLRANCAGGIAFGYDYDNTAWTVNQSQPNQFVWITGDSLCSPDGPCNLALPSPSAAAPPASPPGQTPPAQPAAGQPDDPQANNEVAKEQGDDSEVHGVQGLREAAFDEIAPGAAYGAYPTNGSGPYPPAGPSQAYLIDTDINVDGSGNLIPEELTRNDATRIGDVAIFTICAAQPPGMALELPPAPPTTLIDDGHAPEPSHLRYYSHGREFSHHRWASHWPAMSHYRWSSQHDRWRSRIHEVRPSRVHRLEISYVHDVRPSYVHERRRSLVHDTPWSRLHEQRPSRVHDLRRSSQHDRRLSSANHVPPGSHGAFLSRGNHVPLGSHLLALSRHGHFPIGSHLSTISRRGHVPAGSHLQAASRQSHVPLGSHNAVQSKSNHVPLGSAVHLQTQPTQTHLTALSRRGHVPVGSHAAAQSQGQIHRPVGSHQAAQSQAQTHKPVGSHQAAQSQAQAHKPVGSHTTGQSALRNHRPAGSHSTSQSSAQAHKPAGSHASAQSQARVHRPVGSHSAASSRGSTINKKPAHTQTRVPQRHTTTTRVRTPTHVTHRPATRVNRTTTVHRGRGGSTGGRRR